MDLVENHQRNHELYDITILYIILLYIMDITG